ncbi:hypothetical protein V2J09_011765 [Rumex salicifolius]
MGSIRLIPHAILVFVWIWITTSSQANSLLVPDEVRALYAIAKELRKTDWNFSVDPCTSNDTTWSTPQTIDPTFINQINCTCNGDDSCHVINISLKGQDLPGVLPPSLSKLPHLQRIDFSRNYLSGSIPREWSSLASLEYMSFIVNRLSGPIPAYLANMTNLTYLSIENNRFSGPVPHELGKLIKLQSLTLNANYLTGQLPKALINLSNLIELRMSSNNFSGKLPDYFRSWTALQSLEIQGSGFSGPIPPSIAKLTALIELRISDLHGEGSDFPELGNMENLTNLMLRNCNISGSIPTYLPTLSNLKSLDLSFNNLVGPIPDLKDPKVQYMYLTNNFLNESIPVWIMNIGEEKHIDLSYNKLNKSSLPYSCDKDNLSLAVCLDLYPCSHDRYSLHINCGGNRAKVGKTSYEADDDTGSSAKFNPNKAAEWGYSSTGHFWNLKYQEDYTAKNDYDPVLPVTDDANLYSEARISALSLTYYGRCLAMGNYTVVLYFAEIRFTNNNSFHKLGRRVFDIYIQEKLVKQDFDIVKAANGSEKACNVTVKQVTVTETKTIEIRFYYAGKGTTAVPIRGTYGPLISAISMESVGSSTSVIVLAIIAYCTFVWWWRQKNLPSREEVLQGIDLQTSSFTYRQIKAATDNFDHANKIGEGGFGSVYRGTLLDGTFIAVKRLSSKSSQGNKEFVTEIGMISGLHHPNLVRLYGCCVEGPQLFLVYEYMVNNNLARALFGKDNKIHITNTFLLFPTDEDWPLRLDWPTRQKICTELAKGLVFLHEDSAIKIIHRDIKPTNVLLDENLNAKISDFGLARLHEEENTHISTRVAGTIGYMSPEYALWGYLTYKADVYSFGVVALEIVAGRSNMDFLGNEYDEEEAVRMIKIAVLCTNGSPALRPTMSQVVRMLEGDLSVEDVANDLDAYVHLPVRRPQ